SLRVPLRRLEGRLDPARSAEVAMTLGRYHFARGEYRDAVAAFARSSARLEPSRKPDARYWMGLSWLGLGEPAQARATLEGGARRDRAAGPGRRGGADRLLRGRGARALARQRGPPRRVSPHRGARARLARHASRRASRGVRQSAAGARGGRPGGPGARRGVRD